MERPAARLILFNSRSELLLFRIEIPPAPGRIMGPFWVTPGGAVEPGESFEQAAARELREETGIERCSLGPCVAFARYELEEPDGVTQVLERYFVASCEAEAVDTARQAASELAVLRGHRWWTVGELRSTTETIVPGGLRSLALQICAGGSPAEPVDITR